VIAWQTREKAKHAAHGSLLRCSEVEAMFVEIWIFSPVEDVDGRRLIRLRESPGEMSTVGRKTVIDVLIDNEDGV
jgi:hypothetical protein